MNRNNRAISFFIFPPLALKLGIGLFCPHLARSRFAPSGVDYIKDESFVNTKNEVGKRNRPRNLQKISSSLPHVNDFVAFLIFSPSFLQKQFTKQACYIVVDD
jgi:hypothetical protein